MAGLNWRCGLWWSLPLIWASRIGMMGSTLFHQSLLWFIIDYVINQHGSSRVINLSVVCSIFGDCSSQSEGFSENWKHMRDRHHAVGGAFTEAACAIARAGFSGNITMTVKDGLMIRIMVCGSPSDCWVVSWYIVARNTDLKCGSMRSTMQIYLVRVSLWSVCSELHLHCCRRLWLRGGGLYYIYSTRIGNEKDGNVIYIVLNGAHVLSDILFFAIWCHGCCFWQFRNKG